MLGDIRVTISCDAPKCDATMTALVVAQGQIKAVTSTQSTFRILADVFDAGWALEENPAGGDFLHLCDLHKKGGSARVPDPVAAPGRKIG